MSPPKPSQRTTTAAMDSPSTPKRSGVRSSSSNSSSSSSVTLASTNSVDLSSTAMGGKDNLVEYSPSSEILSLSDEMDDLDDLDEGVPEDLDEGFDFEPKPGDAVWVKSKDTERETWYHGHVQKSTRNGTVRGGKQGTFYSVRYHRNLRRYFAPLLGDIKPDTPRVRRLLEQAGCDLEL